MKRTLLCCLLLFASLAVAQVYSPTPPPAPITSSGGSFTVDNRYGGYNASFEEIPSGSPSTVSITITPCMRGTTCDAVADTNTSTSAAIRFVTFAKAYSYFIVTASWTGGTNVSIQVNPYITTSRNGSGGSGSGTVTSVSDLAPLFTTATRTTTPLFSLTTAGAHNFFGNNTGGSTTPAYFQPACTDLSDAGPLCNLATLTAHALVVGNGSAAPNFLASPTTNGPCQVYFNVTGSTAVDPTCALPGISVDARTTTTESVLGDSSGASSDRSRLVTTSNGSAIALTVLQAGSSGWASNASFVHCNIGAGVATDTPTTSTINGNATLTLVGQVSGNNPECAFWWSNNANYFGAEILPTDTNGRLQAAGMPAFTGDWTNAAGSLAATLVKLNVNATPYDYIAGGGSAQAQTATLSPALTANTTGAQLTFLPVAANTAAAPTLAVNGLTAKTITKCGTVALVAGDLLTTAPAEAIYDGTEWVLLNPQGIGCATTSGGYIFNGVTSATAVVMPAANSTKLWAFIANASLVTSAHFTVNVTTVDNSANLYNFAVFCAAGDPRCTSGNPVCQTGAIAGSSIPTPGSTGLKIIAWNGACGPFVNGQRYYFAETAVTSTLVIGGVANLPSPVCGQAPATNNTTASAVWTTPITYSGDTNIVGCNGPALAIYPN